MLSQRSMDKLQTFHDRSTVNIPPSSSGLIPRHSAIAAMADAISSLEARLASLEQNGFKLNPATANPGERGCRQHLISLS